MSLMISAVSSSLRMATKPSGKSFIHQSPPKRSNYLIQAALRFERGNHEEITAETGSATLCGKRFQAELRLWRITVAVRRTVVRLYRYRHIYDCSGLFGALHQEARSCKASSKRSRSNEWKCGNGRISARSDNIGSRIDLSSCRQEPFPGHARRKTVHPGQKRKGQIGIAFLNLPADDSARANPNAAGHPSKFRNRRRRCFSTASSLGENLRVTSEIRRKRRLRARSARPWLKPFGTSGDDGGKRSILHPAEGAEGRGASASRNIRSDKAAVRLFRHQKGRPCRGRPIVDRSVWIRSSSPRRAKSCRRLRWGRCSRPGR